MSGGWNSPPIQPFISLVSLLHVCDVDGQSIYYDYVAHV